MVPTAASIGEVLFSKRGLSGVCIMQLARFLPENTENCHIYLDFSPTLGIDYCNKHKASDINMPFDMGLVAPSDIYKNTQIALDFLQSRLTILNKEDILLGALPSKLTRICTKNSLNETAKAVTALKFWIIPPDFEHAQVVSGGISTENIDPSTMQTVYSNLYISGETLNVDGDCGYNLMFAFAGIIAAMHVAGKY